MITIEDVYKFLKENNIKIYSETGAESYYMEIENDCINIYVE